MSIMETFQTIAEVIISARALWIVFAFIALGWLVVSGVLLYHWRSYGKGDTKVRRMGWTYLIGSILLLLSAISFIVSL